MVATCSSRYSNSDFRVSAPPRQSSVRSVSSTHSRRSLSKPIGEQSHKQVRFACIDELDLSGHGVDDVGIIEHSVHFFEPIEPLCALYYTGQQISDFRLEMRREAVQFSLDYPEFSDTVSSLYNTSVHIELSEMKDTFRRRRRRKNPFKPRMEWLDLDDEDRDSSLDEEVYGSEDEDELKEEYCDDEVESPDFYCPMRGLETRFTPQVRQRRRSALRSVLTLQKEMLDAGCCSGQIEIGLRAASVQVSQKSRSFSLRQAALDTLEVVDDLA